MLTARTDWLPSVHRRKAGFNRHLATNLEQVVSQVRSTGGPFDDEGRRALARAEDLVVKLRRDADAMEMT